MMYKRVTLVLCVVYGREYFLAENLAWPETKLGKKQQEIGNELPSTYKVKDFLQLI